MMNLKNNDLISPNETTISEEKKYDKITPFSTKWSKKYSQAYPLQSENSSDLTYLEVTDVGIESTMEARLEIAASFNENEQEDGVVDMDDATKMMIEKLDRDGSERESRYHNDAAEREKRYREDQKTILTAITDMKTDFRADISRFESSIKAEFTSLKQDVKSDITKIDTKLDSTYKHITAITIAAILGIGAVVIAVIIK